MTQGDLRYFEPGQKIPVALVAGPNGEVAERGDAVELVDQQDGRTRVRLSQGRGTGIGHLHRAPKEHEQRDEDVTYAAGELIGRESTTVYVDGPIDWFDPSDGYVASVDDLVVFDAGGTVDLYQPAAPVDGGEDDNPEMIAGRVFATGTRASAETAGKVAIIRKV